MEFVKPLDPNTLQEVDEPYRDREAGVKGSAIQSRAVTDVMNEVVHTIDFFLGDGSAGSAQDDEDLEQLRKSIEKAIADAVGDDVSLASLPVFPEINTADNRLSITDNADGTLTVDAAQTWLWRGHKLFSTDNIDLADRTVTTVADKTYHLRWHSPGEGTATPAETYPNGRFELADMNGLTETDRQYDSSYDQMLVARIVSDGSNASTVTTLKNAVELSDEVRWHTSTHGASHYIEGFSYSVLVATRDTNSWGGLLLVPPTVHEINWARSPNASWQFGLMTSNSNSNDPIIINDNNGSTLSDGSGTLSIINNRYEQYPIGRSDTNQPNTSFNFLGVQIKGVLDA